MKKQQTCECTTCFYCDAPLSSRHEHDHFPIPKSCGGTQVYPACMNCHDLKDRVSLGEWPAAGVFRAWGGMTPEARIFVAKIMRLNYEFGAPA